MQEYGDDKGVCTGLIFELCAMLLLFEMVFSFISAAVVWEVLDSACGCDLSSVTIAPN